MKVALVGPYPEPGQPITGGVERVVDTLLPELGRHVEVTLVVPNAARDLESRSHGCRTIYLRRGPGPGVLRYWNLDAERVRRAVSSLDPDLVHIHGLAGLGRTITSPRILTVHGIAERDLVASGNGRPLATMARRALAHMVRHVEKSSRRRIGNVIVINRYVEEVLPDVSRLHRVAIPNPIDREFGIPARDPNRTRPRRIVTIGRISPLKNTLGAIRLAAAAIKADRSVTLSVCGAPVDQKYYEECREFVRSEGLEASVEFLGSLTLAELVRVLDTAALLVVTSHQENAPMAVAEAQARGVPVLAPHAFGMAHMISPGEDGLFLSHTADVDAGLVRDALARQWQHEAIATAARERYGVGPIVQQTLDFYRQVVASHDLGHATVRT